MSFGWKICGLLTLPCGIIVGSVVWVINGFLVLLPLVAPWSAFPNEAGLGGGVSALIGATIFEFGSVLFMLEAVNENRELLFRCCSIDWVSVC